MSSDRPEIERDGCSRQREPEERVASENWRNSRERQSLVIARHRTRESLVTCSPPARTISRRARRNCHGRCSWLVVLSHSSRVLSASLRARRIPLSAALATDSCLTKATRMWVTTLGQVSAAAAVTVATVRRYCRNIVQNIRS